MKVALVHDYLREYGGAERVLEALHEIWPEAPIYTLFYLPEFLGPHRERIEKWDIRPIIPSRTPFLSKITSILRVLAPILFSRLDLSEYDVVIVSATGAYLPNNIRVKSQRPKTNDQRPIHICYCHTPPRYLYGYPTAREWKKYWWVRIPAEIANHFLRLVDFRSAQKVDYFIANSKNIARRIEKFYRREAKVIYPPVEVAAGLKHLPSVPQAQHHLEGESPSYFLTGGRLARAKRVDLAVEACTKLNLPLKVFGRMFAGYGEELKKMAACPPKSAGRRWGPTVEFLGEVDDQKLAELYAGCRAFIFPAEEEDFGIAPVEAMAFGKPVIAFRSGGVVESVVDPSTGSGQAATGVFFDKPSVESLIEALKQFDNLTIDPLDCQKQAQKFSKERFKKAIKEFVEDKLERKK